MVVVEYFESYVPVDSWAPVRMVMPLVIQQGWSTRQVYFSNAFLQASVKEEVYVELLEMLRDEQNHSNKEVINNELEHSWHSLTREEGDATTTFAFLGVSILLDPDTTMLKLIQEGLIKKVLAATGMSDCSTREFPNLCTPLGTDADGPRRKEQWNYVSGMLLYLSSNAHPEIQFAVHQCARFTHCPRVRHEEAVCRYLQRVTKNVLIFKPSADLQLNCYVDADFAGLWNFTKEAEYIALSQAMRELIPLRRLLSEIITSMDLPGVKDAVLKSTGFEDTTGPLARPPLSEW
jgi:hypothetical protein